MPLGNSITLDQTSSEPRFAQDKISYRYFLWDSLRVNNYNTDFIGNKFGGYYQFPDPENNGVPGIRDDEVFKILKTGDVYIDDVFQMKATYGPYLETYSPDVVLLHVGTNAPSSSAADVQNILNLIDTTSTGQVEKYGLY